MPASQPVAPVLTAPTPVCRILIWAGELFFALMSCISAVLGGGEGGEGEGVKGLRIGPPVLRGLSVGPPVLVLR